jgi:Fe-S cluster biogenesis protein NfuA
MPKIEIQFEKTPNPATLKFMLSQSIVSDTLDFTNAQDAERSPLAAKIFGFPWTSGVFLGPNFVTVTKQDWVDWDILAEPLAGLIKEHIESDLPILTEFDSSMDESEEESDTDSEIVRKIKRILKNEIRPVVALDGGDVVFSSYAEGVLSLQMKGSCSGCPSKSVTLKEGIEVRFKELLPEIKEVVAV